MSIFKKAALAACAVIAFSGQALAEYPERAITMVIPWAAGGGTDATGRIIATMLEEKLGQPITVVNRTGGGGIVGHQELKNLKPDGYTIGVITTELSMYKSVGSADLSFEDFTPIGLYNADPSAIFVRADSPYKTIADLIAVVKENPAAIKASGANFGGNNHIAWVSLIQLLGGPADKAFWVPTDGATVSLQLLASNAINVAISQFPEAKALVDAGEIRPLAYLGNERNPKQPDVPPISEAAGIQFAVSGWRGVAAPKGIPEDVQKKLASTLEEIVTSEQFRTFMDGRNFGVVWKGGADFEAYLKQRDEAFGAAIKTAGIKAN